MSDKLYSKREKINDTFHSIKKLIVNSRDNVYNTINTGMINLYWNIGKAILDVQHGNERATYGKTVIEELSKKLTTEFGKGFSKRNLERMRKFYVYFPELHKKIIN